MRHHYSVGHLMLYAEDAGYNTEPFIRKYYSNQAIKIFELADAYLYCINMAISDYAPLEQIIKLIYMLRTLMEMDMTANIKEKHFLAMRRESIEHLKELYG